MAKYHLNWGWHACSAEGSLKQWLPNGKLLLLSLTKCHGVPCSLLWRITTKVLKNCKTFSSRPRPRLHDPRPRLSFLSSRHLETKTLVSRTTSQSNSNSIDCSENLSLLGLIVIFLVKVSKEQCTCSTALPWASPFCPIITKLSRNLTLLISELPYCISSFRPPAVRLRHSQHTSYNNRKGKN